MASSFLAWAACILYVHLNLYITWQVVKFLGLNTTQSKGRESVWPMAIVCGFAVYIGERATSGSVQQPFIYTQDVNLRHLYCTASSKRKWSLNNLPSLNQLIWGHLERLWSCSRRLYYGRNEFLKKHGIVVLLAITWQEQGGLIWCVIRSS